MKMIIILAIKADNTFKLKETSLGFRVVVLQIEIIGCYVGGTVNSSSISEQKSNFFFLKIEENLTFQKLRKIWSKMNECQVRRVK
jgi:hypothetical protein